MRDYEVVFIAHPDLDENAFKEVVDRVSTWITEAGGAISKVDVWGKRKLAFDIKKQKDGQYVLIKAQMPNEAGAQIERNLRFLEPIMRFLITAVE